jgi:hypothetical protein
MELNAASLILERGLPPCAKASAHGHSPECSVRDIPGVSSVSRGGSVEACTWPGCH